MAKIQIRMGSLDGHLYAGIVTDVAVTWQAAHDAASTIDSLSSLWQMVSITDDTENVFVTKLIRPLANYITFIGLVQDPSGQEPAGGWSWSSGETLTYANWSPGEPNDGNGEGEDYGTMFASGMWNDENDACFGAVYELSSNIALNMNGSLGADLLRGGDLGDYFRGRDGDDRLRGALGDDSLFGGAGNDSLSGTSGADVLSGGDGADEFFFGRVGYSDSGTPDVIVDFQQGLDSIDLSRIDAIRGTALDDAFVLIFGQPFDGIAGQLRFDSTAKGDTRVQADTNGDGHTDFALILRGSIALTEADFSL